MSNPDEVPKVGSPYDMAHLSNVNCCMIVMKAETSLTIRPVPTVARTI